MPIPTLISELSTTAASNSPDGAIDIPSSLDNYQRAHAAFIAQLRDRTAADWPNTPAGAIAATTVQAAINELDTEKAKAGANSDITSLTGLTTPLSAALGGTGMANGFVSSIVANGYQKLPSGLIIQWGSTVTTAAGDQVISFPIAFPNAALQAVCTFNNSTKVDVTVTIGSLTTTTAYIGALSAGVGAAASVSYMAIGY